MSLNLLVLVIDDFEHCASVLEAWERAGVPGVTVIDSAGSRRMHGRDDLPLMVSLRAMLSGEESPNRTLFSVIDDDAVLDKAVEAARRIIGDFQQRHTGILFVMPVARAWGVLKVRPHGEGS